MKVKTNKNRQKTRRKNKRTMMKAMTRVMTRVMMMATSIAEPILMMPARSAKSSASLTMIVPTESLASPGCRRLTVGMMMKHPHQQACRRSTVRRDVRTVIRNRHCRARRAISREFATRTIPSCSPRRVPAPANELQPSSTVTTCASHPSAVYTTRYPRSTLPVVRTSTTIVRCTIRVTSSGGSCMIRSAPQRTCD